MGCHIIETVQKHLYIIPMMILVAACCIVWAEVKYLGESPPYIKKPILLVLLALTVVLLTVRVAAWIVSWWYDTREACFHIKYTPVYVVRVGRGVASTVVPYDTRLSCIRLMGFRRRLP